MNLFPPSKLKARLHNSIDPILMEDSVGIYIIPATILEDKRRADYIGMTTRNFKERLTEHFSDIKLNRCCTAIAKLNQEQEVMIYFKKAKLIKNLSNCHKLIIMESIEILRCANYIVSFLKDI